MNPGLSIILPVYNGARHLPEALESLCAQDDIQEVEIIAVDDGSTDHSPVILRDYQRKLPMVCPPHSRTGNWAANTNAALSMARGRHICFLHQDDLWLDGRLAWILDTLRREPGAPVLLSNALFLSPEGRASGVWRAPFPQDKERTLAPMSWFAPLLVQNYLGIPAPVVRRDILNADQPLDEHLKYTADWHLWLSLAAQHPAIYYPRPTVGFRLHTSSQTCTITSDPREYRQQLEAVFQEHQGHLPDGPEGDRWRAAGQLGMVVNEVLAALYHRHAVPWRRLGRAVREARWSGFRLFWRSSRIAERLGARVRTLLKERLRPRAKGTT